MSFIDSKLREGGKQKIRDSIREGECMGEVTKVLSKHAYIACRTISNGTEGAAAQVSLVRDREVYSWAVMLLPGVGTTQLKQSSPMYGTMSTERSSADAYDDLVVISVKQDQDRRSVKVYGI